MSHSIIVADELDKIRREEVVKLLRVYEASLGLTLDFQQFEAELAAFPRGYRAPDGCLLLALDADGGPVDGLVGVRRLEPEVCEMKRLYVRPSARGQNLGRRLAQASIDAARRLGYATMRLDTLSFMAPAIGLYRSLGFQDIENYNGNPVPGARFFERRL